MIQFNLKEDEWKNHEMDGRYGMITTNSLYAGYPVTIVDNHEEIVNGRYTNKPALCLVHLSEDVRQYIHLKLFSEFLYISFSYEPPTYRMYEYKKVELSNEEIIKVLKGIFYNLQPSLQSRSMVGSTSKALEDDPNYYGGRYVLNDEETYTILKCGTTFKFFKGAKSYYPDWKDTTDLLYVGKIDFDVYKLALEVSQLRKQIVTLTNQLLDKQEFSSIEKYQKLKLQLEELIKTI